MDAHTDVSMHVPSTPLTRQVDGGAPLELPHLDEALRRPERG
jgi:hypothetical protein